MSSRFLENTHEEIDCGGRKLFTSEQIARGWLQIDSCVFLNNTTQT
jgi:hypothetical protein